MNDSNLKVEAEELVRMSLRASTIRTREKHAEKIERDLPRDFILNTMTQQEVSRLAYKSMDARIYYGASIILYALEVYLSIIVTNLSDIFNFIGTVAGSNLSFFIPSVLFIRAFHSFASTRFKARHKTLYRLAIGNFLAGIALFALFLYSNVLSLK